MSKKKKFIPDSVNNGGKKINPFTLISALKKKKLDPLDMLAKKTKIHPIDLSFATGILVFLILLLVFDCF